MRLPAVDSLRVPARFWLMTTLCLSVFVGLVVAEMTRARSRNVALAIALIAGGGLLTDGWVDRIQAAPLPRPVPGASALAGSIVLEAPSEAIIKDIYSVWRAVDGGWRAVNGYSGWGPSYYRAFVGAGRADVDDWLTPFQQFGALHVIVGTDAPRMQAVVERQPGVARIASDEGSIVYRLPRREAIALPEPRGERVTPRALRSECAQPLLPLAIDGDETTLWQCGLWDERQSLIVDLGEPRMVGSVVHSLGSSNWLFPGGLHVQTSEDGSAWTDGWSGGVLDRTIRTAMADPKRLRIVVAFPARVARYIRLRADPGTPDAPWAIADLEIWSSSSESR